MKTFLFQIFMFALLSIAAWLAITFILNPYLDWHYGDFGKSNFYIGIPFAVSIGGAYFAVKKFQALPIEKKPRESLAILAINAQWLGGAIAFCILALTYLVRILRISTVGGFMGEDMGTLGALFFLLGFNVLSWVIGLLSVILEIFAVAKARQKNSILPYCAIAYSALASFALIRGLK